MTGVSHQNLSAEDESPTLSGLTEAQRQGVLATEGPVLILAGPGSGKTRVITRRIAYLIGCGIPAWQILALTFTNKAAAEMRERVTVLLGEGPLSRGLTVTTFHSLCARLIRKYAGEPELGGLTASFAICDAADQASLMKKVIEALNLSTANFPPRSVLSRISAAKNELLDAAAFAREAGDFASRTIAKIYAAYEKALHTGNMVDFDDLLVLTVRLLKGNTRAREECRRRWQYLLIDEYQDTNHAQFMIASLLAGPGAADADGARRPPNICVVGDPDQSIYGWRGADISNIMDFEQQYPSAVVIALGENFRSTPPILAAADAMIRKNKRRKHKDLFTSRRGGDKVRVMLCRDEHHEARLVLEWMKGFEEIAWKDIAVFYRTNALSRVMEDVLRDAGVPYIIARGTAYYQREEIKHALAYLRVVANPADGVSLSRIINTPARGIGDATWSRIEAASAEMGVRAIEGLRMAASGEGGGGGAMPELAARARNAVGKFVAMLDSWTGSGTFMGGGGGAGVPPAFESSGTGVPPVFGSSGAGVPPAFEIPALPSAHPTSLAGLVERVVRESGLEQMYKAGKTDTDEERLANLAELVSSARDFEDTYDPASDPAGAFVPPGGIALPGDAEQGTAQKPGGTGAMPPLLAMLRAYLERVTLVADADSIDPSQGAVTLMTLHAAKGLEFRAVAMIGLEEGTLPHSRSDQSEEQLEEERRLCFVGITRAMERLLLSAAKYRTIRGISERTVPSRFLGELPREEVVVTDESDSFAEGYDFEEGGFSRGRGDRSASGDGGAAAEPGNWLRAGAMVRHPQFGLGVVKSVTRGADARAKIAFQGVGEKTLVLEYARLQRV